MKYQSLDQVLDKCSTSDSIRLYFPSNTIDLNVSTAIKAAEYWVDFVLEQDKQFTNSLAMQLIERAKYDLLVQALSANSSSNFSNKLSNLFPNFVEYMKEFASLVPCHQVTDNATKLEYKAPILTYGRTMGYNHYIIERKSDVNFEIYLIANGNGGKQLYSQRIVFSGDKTMDKYNEMFQNIAGELMTNPLYLQITISGF